MGWAFALLIAVCFIQGAWLRSVDDRLEKIEQWTKARDEWIKKEEEKDEGFIRKIAASKS